MEILSSGELANLTKREADVAIRVVYDRKTLPLNLHGLKGPELFGGVYISRDRLAAWRAGAPDPIRWVVISVHGISDWAGEGEVRTTGVPFRVTDGETQIVAVRQGLGMTTLPRSEEHKSELQSLMRTSYAVFCLKKKKKTQE